MRKIGKVRGRKKIRESIKVCNKHETKQAGGYERIQSKSPTLENPVLTQFWSGRQQNKTCFVFIGCTCISGFVLIYIDLNQFILNLLPLVHAASVFVSRKMPFPDLCTWITRQKIKKCIVFNPVFKITN